VKRTDPDICGFHTVIHTQNRNLWTSHLLNVVRITDVSEETATSFFTDYKAERVGIIRSFRRAGVCMDHVSSCGISFAEIETFKHLFFQ